MISNRFYVCPKLSKGSLATGYLRKLNPLLIPTLPYLSYPTLLYPFFSALLPVLETLQGTAGYLSQISVSWLAPHPPFLSMEPVGSNSMRTIVACVFVTPSVRFSSLNKLTSDHVLGKPDQPSLSLSLYISIYH